MKSNVNNTVTVHLGNVNAEKKVVYIKLSSSNIKEYSKYVTDENHDMENVENKTLNNSASAIPITVDPLSLTSIVIKLK